MVPNYLAFIDFIAVPSLYDVWEKLRQEIPSSLRQKQVIGLDCEHHYLLASKGICSASAASLCQIYPLSPEEDWGHFLTFLLLIVLLFSPLSALNGL